MLNLGINVLSFLFIYRVWAKKPYVDPKRIGIWGWVRVFYSIFAQLVPCKGCSSVCAPTITPELQKAVCEVGT